MSIGLIIFLVVWLISTEVVFFAWARNSSGDFLMDKVLSIFAGLMATLILYVLPWAFANAPARPEEAFGNIFYAWYYGTGLGIAAFFLINYKVHKWLEGKGK